MKKHRVLPLFLFLIFLTSCNTANTTPDKLERIEGYIKIDGDTVMVDKVQIVNTSNEKLVKELGLKDEDLVSVYYVYNPEEEYEKFTLSDNAYYIFTDMNNKYLDVDVDNKEYITNSRDEFLEYLESTYSQLPNKVPYILYVNGNKVEIIYENFTYTI